MSDIVADLLKRAVLAFAELSNEEKRAHMAAQRKAWVIAEIMIRHPEMTRSDAERIYHQVVL
jgi:hypothetical protein